MISRRVIVSSTAVAICTASGSLASEWHHYDLAELYSELEPSWRSAQSMALESEVDQTPVSVSIVRTELLQPELVPEGALHELALSMSHPTNPMRSHIIFGVDKEVGEEGLCKYTKWRVEIDDREFDVIAYRRDFAIRTLLQISGPEKPNNFWAAFKTGGSMTVRMHEECGFRDDPEDYEYAFSLDGASAAMDYVLENPE